MSVMCVNGTQECLMTSDCRLQQISAIEHQNNYEVGFSVLEYSEVQ